MYFISKGKHRDTDFFQLGHNNLPVSPPFDTSEVMNQYSPTPTVSSAATTTTTTTDFLFSALEDQQVPPVQLHHPLQAQHQDLFDTSWLNNIHHRNTTGESIQSSFYYKRTIRS